MEKVQQLGYVRTGATDLGAWRRYATEVLGHEIAPDSDDRALYLRIDERHHRLLIERADANDVTSVGWEVADASRMEALASQVETQGVKVAAATTEECDRRRLLDFVKFTCPFTGVQVEIGYGPEVQFLPH